MKLKFFSSFSIALLTLLTGFGFSQSMAQQPRILVLKKSSGYHHASIPLGALAVIKLGKENGFLVDTTSDASKIEESNLKKYAALVFVSTTGSFLNNYQQIDLERYIQAGGGFVGIHAAADAEYDWHWYGRMIGGYFAHHNAGTPVATLNVVDRNNIATKMLPEKWVRNDEYYHYKSVAKDLHVLIKVDESSLTYKPSDEKFKMGDHPIAWYHNFEGGRVFYTGLGHTDESYSDPLYLQHVLGGIKYAIGTNQKLNYAKAKTPRVPDENRFKKVDLVNGVLNEPTEMTVLPNLDILIVERRGGIQLYNHLTKKIQPAGSLNVYCQTLKAKGVNAEEGVMGIQADPDYKTNHYVYIYYAPADSIVNRLSRFTFTNNKIDKSSEKVILEVHTMREICCHTGGSIAFGKDHVLFLSVGDNTTPFDETLRRGLPNTHSFAPLDDRPGHEQFDDRRSAGNSNDLRGKILRIKINKDGSYDIPEGNLFPKGTAKTRPEIFVMGDRNPYRISVDKKSGFLYWGEVGPDANNDSLATRGPRGYDEVNQARKSGLFGWPYFIGPNIPYHEYDYETGKTGIVFDPLHPVNNSRNNTGLRELPAAQPAFIWYPYAVSTEFPQLGTGGRSAAAGPVYHSEDYTSPGKFPSYYDNKLFIYDFVRDWMKVITMTPEGDYDSMEPFMEKTKLVAPIDMEMGPDGKIYILGYGTSWFKKDDDAGLYRIDYNAGNRAPEISAFSANKIYGSLPLTVSLKVKATDPEKDKITYTWNLGNGIKKVTTQPSLVYTYTKKGNYAVTVTAKDSKLASTTSKSVYIAAGNAEEVANPASPYAAGQALMLSLDCKSCHSVTEKSIGPAFTDVAAKYPKTDGNVNRLAKKIQNGGSGVWGDATMPAHPSLKTEEAKQILDWIFSLKD